MPTDQSRSLWILKEYSRITGQATGRWGSALEQKGAVDGGNRMFERLKKRQKEAPGRWRMEPQTKSNAGENTTMLNR